MLDPDISTTAALAHLSRPETDRFAVDRRRFLQLVGMGLGAGLVAGPGSSLLDAVLPGHDPSAWAVGPVGPTDGILVIVGLYGGNDGLNTVVPFNDGNYYDQRRSSSLEGKMSLTADETLHLDANSGLNPELTEFKRFWDDGQLAIVEGVGHGVDDLSHFNSMAKWMSGHPTATPSSGWVGRWLDQYLSGGPDLFAAAEIGYTLPLHMQGRRQRATTVPPAAPDFGLRRAGRESVDDHLYQSIRNLATVSGAGSGSWIGRVGQAQTDQLHVAQTLNPVIPSEMSQTPIVASLETAARLINANLGFRVVTAGFGDFDSHASQPALHTRRIRDLNTALQKFFEVLDPSWAGQVTVMTFSEFGRTTYANDGYGTDHGTAAPQFVLGKNVKGGFYGERPSLAKLGRWDRMDTNVDMRNYLGSVMDGWLGGGARDVLGSGFTEDLGIFRSAPQGPTFASTVGGQFVGLSPVRIYDSRSGLGGRSTSIGPGETVRVRVTGLDGVPSSGVRAVAINISSIHPTSPTFLTAFPTGFHRPGTASVNPRPGAVVPNMAVVGVGADGTVSIYNDRGDVHITVDLMGYFQEAPANKLSPLTPSRILDTRIGVGSPQRRAAAGSPLVLEVLGRGGVPAAGVDSVVLNLTSVRPVSNGWITAWPTGVGKPVVANLSYRAGETIPNMVMCKIGPDGRINLEPSAGDLDLVADVVGCYTSDGTLMQPMVPSRLLDTRNGTGAPLTKLTGGGEIVLQVAGRGGVPDAATAAILNVTGIRSDRGTYLTVYPDGESRPTAASLNPAAGSVNGNLIVTKLGAGGRVRIYNHAGALDLTADVNGYFVS